MSAGVYRRRPRPKRRRVLLPSKGYVVVGNTSLYVPVSTDIARNLRCKVTATNSYGSSYALSNGLGPILNRPPAVDTNPVVTGVFGLGQVLSCSQGTWLYGATGWTYQWLQDGSPIGGATNNTYTIQAGDLIHGLSCKVTATGSGGVTDTFTNILYALAVTVSTGEQAWVRRKQRQGRR